MSKDAKVVEKFLEGRGIKMIGERTVVYSVDSGCKVFSISGISVLVEARPIKFDDGESEYNFRIFDGVISIDIPVKFPVGCNVTVEDVCMFIHSSVMEYFPLVDGERNSET